MCSSDLVVSIMQILFPTNLAGVMTKASAAAMLVFSLLYTPCVAAIASIRRELGSKWAFSVVIWQCVIGWAVAWVVRMICLAAGLG